jgi:Ca2+-binding EF-hand superfamily protein
MVNQIEVRRCPGRRRASACLWSLALAVGLTSSSPAEDSATRSDEQVQAPNDAQSLLFFGPLRPVWIRLRVTIDGKPFRESWQANIQRLFAEADADGDGVVRTIKSAGDKPTPTDSIAALAAASAVYLGQEIAQARAGLEKTAAEGGGMLSFAAFQKYFEQAAPPFSLAVGLGRTSAGQALFGLLDANGDQQLTADELNGAEERLRIRDFDDNESLTRLELVDAPNTSLAAISQTADETRSSPLPMAGPLAMVDLTTPPAAIREAILAEYDRDHDGKISTSGTSAEITPTPAQLARLDVLAGEPVDGQALARFCVGGPDVELKVELGKISLTSRRFGAPRARAETNTGPRIKQRPDGSLDLTLDDAHIYLRRNNRDPSKNNDSGPSLQNFDADNNGYLDDKELANVPNLAGAFEVIDADHDGKVFAGELQSYVDRQNRAASVRLLLEVFDQGQELFDHLDENHDYRLSTRELHNAAEIVKQIDANHDGRLSADEIPQQLMLELSRNTPQAAVTERRSIRGGERVRPAAKRGPGWFQKMDRNDDGELSPREFLGPPDVFKRLDKDKNGVLDPTEVES